MSDTAALERWYRRMLAWYPAEHRRAYGDEMIGVLLASAPEGKRRPGIADTLDLIKGALLARLRPADGNIDAGWRDTFAVFSIAAPAAFLAYRIVISGVQAYRFRALPLPVDLLRFAMGSAEFVLPIALATLLALRARRTAVVVAAVPAILFGFLTVTSFTSYSGTPSQHAAATWYLLFFLLEMIALAISPGPRRGATIMTRPAWAIMASAGCLAGLTLLPRFVPGYPLSDHVSLMLAVITVAGVLCTAAGLLMTLPPPVGARLLLLLAIPGYPATIAISGIVAAGSLDISSPSSIALVYLPIVALVGLVALLAWRSRHRGSAASQDRGSAAS
jgi:hypothetical protein